MRGVFRGSDYPQNRRRKFILAPILFAAAIILFQYLSAGTFVSPETGKEVRVGLSLEQENLLGLQSFKQVLSQSQIVSSGPEFEMVNKVVNKLVPVVDQEAQKFEWAATVVKDEQINAFCLPGGKIAVFTGILPVAQNEAGLATVIGHEIAHATLRHGSQRVFKDQMIQTALQGFSGSLSDYDPGQRQVIIGLLGAGVQYGLVLPYGRDHELEADEIGLRYMVRAGYQPEEAVKFWQRMAEAGKGQPPEWASTHPSHGSRIQRLNELIRQGVR